MGGNLLDGLSNSTIQPANQMPSLLNNSQPLGNNMNAIPPITAYDKGGLKIEFNFTRDDQGVLTITLSATNSNPSPLTNFVFQAAVPKSFQLQLLSPSGNEVAGNNAGAVSQVIKIENPQKTQLRMRLRLSYSLNGMPVQEQGEVSAFPPPAWQ